MGRGFGSGRGRPRKDTENDEKQQRLVFALGVTGARGRLPSTSSSAGGSRTSPTPTIDLSTVSTPVAPICSTSCEADSTTSVSFGGIREDIFSADLYSALGPSASACCGDSESSASSQVASLLLLVKKYETMLKAEVQAWLDGVIDKVAAMTAGGKHFKESRHSYTAQRKAAVVRAYSELHAGNESAHKTVKRLKETVGDSSLSAKKVNRWMKHGPKRKAGRKYNEVFERQVLDELVFTSLEKVDNEQKAVVVANVCYSHELIITAAKKVQAKPQWSNEPRVSKLQFRRTWIRGWLRRNAMRPRRITAQAKELPSPQVVQARMAQIQARIVEGEYAVDEVFNGDETGMFFGAPPKKQYVPISADRATAPESDDKARFTSFLWADSDGTMQPTFNIIKCQSKSSYDLSATTKLRSLHLTFFTAQQGWTLEIWSRTMKLPNAKKEVVEINCKRPYLVHQTSRDVVTCQNKAWMDSVGVAMWCDLQFGPAARAKRGKALMVWDNCTPHKVDAVRDVFAEWGVEVFELPPKMTDILQVSGIW